MSINWGTIYKSPIGQILGDLNPQAFYQMASQGTQSQASQLNSDVQQQNVLIKAWTALQSDAQAVNSDLSVLNQSSTFQPLQATSSQQAVATAADSSAEAGSYQLSVDQLATSEIAQGTPTTAVSSPTAALNLSGTFQVYTGSQPSTQISISSSDNLQQIAAAINQAGAGVTATAVQTASGTWGLDLQGSATGAQNNIHFVVGTSPSGTNPLQALGFSNTSTQGATFTSSSSTFTGTELQAAQDAYLNFGAPMTPPAPGSSPPPGMLSSATNTFTNAIPGLSLTLKSTGSTTITVAPNVSAMSQSIQSFVNDWNQWVQQTQSLAEAGSLTSTAKSSGTATATYTYQSNPHQKITSGMPETMLNQAATILGGAIGPNSATYQSLGSIGVSLQTNGQLTIHQTTLDNALTTNPGAVAQLFQNLYQTFNPATATGVLPAFYQTAPTGVAEEAIAQATQQKSQDQNKLAILNNQLASEQQQATTQYGQWITEVSKAAQQYSVISALFNPSSNNGSSGG